MCSAPNVYMFVYTLIGAQIVPLKQGVEMILKTGTLDYNKSIFG